MNARERALLARIPRKLFIDGTWQDAEHGATLSVGDPSTGQELATISDAGPADALRALDAAAAAADPWAATPPRRRSDLLRAAFDLLTARAEDFALLMTLEMGKPLHEARAEVAYGAEFLRWSGEEAVRIDGRFTPLPEGGGTMVVSPQPVGPCYLITPWNFPLAMATRKLAPALAAGCTAVVKPSELTPLTTLLLAGLLQEVGLPPGVVNVITTSRSPEVSAPVIAHPRLRKLSFTGSTPVGTALLAQAAPHVLRVSMELGGNAPFLVFADADLDAAVEEAMAAKFRNSGQACTAANRFLVQRPVAAEFTRRVAERVSALRVGRGTADGVTIGPLISAAAVARTEQLVRAAVDDGAEVLTGGRRREGPGTFFEPTVVRGARADSAISTQEVFAPVLSVVEFEDEEEAVRLANATEHGLASYVCTRDQARVVRLIGSLQTGMMGVNTGVISNAAAPFGGVKQSGLGREGGREGLQEYLTTKYTLLR